MAPTAIISCYNYPFYNVDLLYRAQTQGSLHQRYNRGALYIMTVQRTIFDYYVIVSMKLLFFK